MKQDAISYELKIQKLESQISKNKKVYEDNMRGYVD